MRTGLNGKVKTVVCLGLALLSFSVVAGGGQDETSSVLNRVQTVDDPELGELILVAIENHPRVAERETLERIRKVTESYAQVKLLDQQIEQIARRAQSTGGPAEMRYELMLARAELESKRTVELANLRELMGIIPRHAFGQRKVSELTTFVDLDVIGDRVYVLERVERFVGDNLRDWFKSAGVMSGKAAMDYVRTRFADKGRLPIRIEIHRTVEGVKLSEELHDGIIEMARQSKVQMEAEVHLGPVRQGVGEFVLTFIGGDAPKIDSVYLVDDRPTVSLVDGRTVAPQEVDPNGIRDFVTQWLTRPDYLPTRFRIVHPAQMEESAEQTVEAVKEVVHRLGVDQFVDVASNVVEPNVEDLYLGRWQATSRSEIVQIMRIDVQDRGLCQFLLSEEPAAKVVGRWSLVGRQIRMYKGSQTYQGYLNAEGDLLLYRKRTVPRGNLVAVVAEQPIVFRRLE